MACKFIINYPHPKDEAVQKLREAVLNKQGTFDGNTNEGHFEVTTTIGAFEVEYTIVNHSITIIVLRKPIFVSCKRIEREVSEYLENNLITANL